MDMMEIKLIIINGAVLSLYAVSAALRHTFKRTHFLFASRTVVNKI